MKKPSSLRAHLSNTIPGLFADPEKFIIYVANGNWRVNDGGSLSYAFMYDLQILIMDFAHDPALVFAHLEEWIKANQHEILSNPDKRADGMRFEIEYLTHETLDILITLKLTEDVIVTQNDDSLTAEYKSEPDYGWMARRAEELGLTNG